MLSHFLLMLNFKHINKLPDSSNNVNTAKVLYCIIVNIIFVKVDNINRMGPYDGLCLSSNNYVDDIDLVDNNDLQTYLGVQGPLQSLNTDNNALIGPTVDGDPNSPQRLFMFANNTASLNCCPSTYSTDRGCVCSTEKQDDLIRRRGFNNSAQNVA